METGSITWDDQPICTDFPSTFDASGLGTISYNGQGALVDNAMGTYERHIVHADLPNGVHLEIFRWSHHINIRITMIRQPHQDGDCGNFNARPWDDTTDLIIARVGVSVSRQYLMFKAWVAPTHGHHPSLNECQGDKHNRAIETCRSSRPGLHDAELDGCVFDVCFAGPQYARQDAAM